jgi:hypothetical protein
MSYEVEAQSRTLRAIVTIGSKPGYEPGRTFTRERVAEVISDISRKIEARGERAVPAIITKGLLVGRASLSDYREKIYQIDFSWSPRRGEMLEGDFLHTASEYAQEIGDALKQTRVYLEVSEETIVFHKTA